MLPRLNRPRPKAAEPRTAPVTARVPAAVAQAVDEYSSAHDESRTSVLLAALEYFLEDHAPELIENARQHPSMKPRQSRQLGPSVMLPGLRVPAELERQFVTVAKDQKITKSELMRRALERYVADVTAQAGLSA